LVIALLDGSKGLHRGRVGDTDHTTVEDNIEVIRTGEASIEAAMR
jgi:hypothetical protein